MSYLSNIVRRPLILHVDINRTIIQTDVAGGKTLQQVLASNVSSTSYGILHDKDWVLRSGPGEPLPDVKEGTSVLSYSDYVDTILHPTPKDLHDKPASERREVMKQLRAKRQPLYYTFVEKGGLGEAYRCAVEQQDKALQRRRAQDGRSKGYWNIIPSFFRLMNELSELDWPVTVFFRTFGTDLPHVLREFKQFVMGSLDYKPRGPWLERLRNHWIEPVTGSLYRDEHGFFLTWGCHVAAPAPPDGAGGLPYLRSMLAYKGAKEIPSEALLQEILSHAKQSNGIAGLVDYYPYWSSHGEAKHAGKIGPTDTDNYHVFFDDNIYLFDETGESIVDFRDALGHPMPDEEAERYAVRVEPFFAITDEEYFVKMLDAKMRDQEKKIKE